MTMPQTVKIVLHDVPDPEALRLLMQRGAAELAVGFPANLGFRLTAVRIAASDGEAERCQIHLELLFPQHQIILNRAGLTPKAALHDALAAARLEIERLALRDRAVAPARKAIAFARSVLVAA
jgi:hypothetical protein